MAKCILFDSDGTLVDSEGISSEALAIAFTDLRISLDAKYLEDQYRGVALHDTLRDLCAEHDVRLPHYFIAQYREIVSELFERQLKPAVGVEAFLMSCDLPVAVVSNGPLVKIRKALALCQLDRFFGESIYSAYELGVWKPNPEIYRESAADMGFNIEDCIVVEDSLTGVEAACKAGANTLFYNPQRQLCSWPITRSFESMSELSELVSHLCQNTATQSSLSDKHERLC